MARTLTWGAMLPHGGSGEYRGRTGGEAWARLSATARGLEDLGFDHLWLSDHLLASGGDRAGIQFEPYTTLAALAGQTHVARLGVLVTCAQYRSVAMLAKQAANVDVFSGGRLILALGGGWDEEEFSAFGLPFPSSRDRVDRFAETLGAVVRLWGQESVDLPGRLVSLQGAACNPRPDHMPPIWTGTHGPRGLRAAARWADVVNWNVGLEEFNELSAVLAGACGDVGRDPTTIDRSVFRLADLTEDQGPLRALLRAEGHGEDLAELVAHEHFVGSPSTVVDQVQEFVDAGATHIVTMFVDAADSLESAERFMREVVPHVRTSDEGRHD